MGLDVELIAINHWPLAIATHSANYPQARHICARIEEVRPREVVPGGRLHLLVASPECTFHSVARGGRPIEDQKRVPAWGVVQWVQELFVENVIIENVPEFTRWGPLGANGRPLKRRVGETYQAFLQALRSLGYQVDERILCCADYGDATTRRRLFIVATRKGAATWPMASHAPREHISRQGKLFAEKRLTPWRAAREIIDWDLKGKNIFERKKPLALKTLKRIAAGMRKINGLDIEPFLVMLYGTNKTRSVYQPLPTVTANGQHIGLCEPFILSQASGGAPRSVDAPVPTICGKGAVQMIEPFVFPLHADGVSVQSGSKNASSTENLSVDIVQPFLVAAGGPQGKGRNPKSVDEPLDTVLTENHDALVQPFLVAVNHGNRKMASTNDRCRPLDDPLPTVTSKNGLGVVEPFLLPHQHGNDTTQNVRSVEEPMPTVTATSSDLCLVEPYISKYYGTGISKSVDHPLDVVTTKARFGLVEPYLIPVGNNRYLGIRFRMLQPHELAAAQVSAKSTNFTETNRHK